jgi:hypothetical protein
MGIVWAIFVPRGLSVGTFTLLALTGPLALLAGSAVWGAHRPSPSVGQTRGRTDEVGTTPSVRR